MTSDDRPAWLVGRHAAGAARHELALGPGPIDIYRTIERRGVALAFHPLDGDDGRYIFHAGRGLIIVNSDCREASRQRFTAAHELGHHEMHRFVDGIERDTYVVDRDVYARQKDRPEKEADAFAAYLLLPDEAIHAECGDRSEIDVDRVLALMEGYGTSFRATVYRLHNTGHITATHRDGLIAAADGRIRALRAEDDRPRGPRPPAALEASLGKLYRAGLVDAKRVGARLGVSAERVVERYGEPEAAPTDADALLAELGLMDG